MNIEMWPIGQLSSYENNPRINDHAVPKLAEAIRAYGFRVPVLVRPDGELIDGHLRVKAAAEVGLEELPVVVVDDMGEEAIRAFRISINRMAELAEWDLELLRFEVEALRGLGEDIELLSLGGLDAKLYPPEVPDKKAPTSKGGQGESGPVCCPRCGAEVEG